MEPCLLIWGFLAFMMVPGCATEFCGDDPPVLRNATFKALTYKIGTMLNCECKKGFRRISKGSLFMVCKGNSSHSSWENKCHCVSTSSGNTGKPVTPKPEERKERKPTEMPSRTQPMDPARLLDRCREPPPWEHEAPERIYHFMVGQTVHYQCTQGFRALRRGPAESVCKTICGKSQWTQPQLKCTSERKDSEFAGDEEPQASTDAPPGSETSCPLTTTGTTGTIGSTDFQIHTEAATTMETFIFTTECQMAVAGCVLLLISILLLSGLTWQRRWRKSRRTI
ncbi:interleukin-2 receptor subunit alpha [Diceros bicornis minor]|uniref:interleukin-2 receptor subunit alpha n=1 Tax=Diceros bicornis minor TaxID=77932 RepID=UPI0026ECFDE2|nr:interleukin-2 receptor subunit alpha [Diceros bicornis minor]